MWMDTLVNKVAESGLVTLNLENYLPVFPIKAFDLKEFLFMGMILKEKDYREALKAFDFSMYKDTHVAVYCSVDAIIPIWAFMLAAIYLEPIAKSVSYATEQETESQLLLSNIEKINAEDFLDQRIVVKGCGEKHITNAAYLAITAKLRSTVKSIMYGEPCSTVPLYKKK